MDYKQLYIYQLTGHYCTARELQYSTTYNYLLEPNELNEFYDFKENTTETFDNSLIRLNLKSFNSKYIYFSCGVDLSQTLVNLVDLLDEDIKDKKQPLAIRNMPEILRSRIFSELEGSLNIEDVPTTRKRVDDLIINGAKPENKNDVIIKNMADAIEFVYTLPPFNKENLFKLYNILSSDSLDYNHKLKEGDYYRYDDVYIDNYIGCPVNKIDECMNSLFDFINSNINNNLLIFYLPHIAHFYVVYIHPYFDFNGRTARMVSLWVSLLTNKTHYPPYISDAINQTKSTYYNVLSESRNARNDITYFLQYILDISILYFLTYQNVEHIEKALINKSISITNLDKDYIKRILVCNNGTFSYTDFINWNHIDISKQGAFKILNRFVNYGILNEVNTNTNKKFFKVNESMIIYKKKK